MFTEIAKYLIKPSTPVAVPANKYICFVNSVFIFPNNEIRVKSGPIENDNSVRIRLRTLQSFLNLFHNTIAHVTKLEISSDYREIKVHTTYDHCTAVDFIN